jgi:hypothetical protein
MKKEKIFLGNCKSSTYVCAYQNGCAFILEKVLAKGTCCGQDQCNCVFGKLSQVGWLVFAIRMVAS